MSSIADVPVESAGALQAGRREVRRELLRELLRSRTFLIGATVLLIWIVWLFLPILQRLETALEMDA